MLRSVELCFNTDVSGKPLSPIFKIQADFCPLKMGPISRPETSGWKYHSTLFKIPKKPLLPGTAMNGYFLINLAHIFSVSYELRSSL